MQQRETLANWSCLPFMLSRMHIEPFEDREKSGFALSVLDSPEQLMMFAQSRNDVSVLISFFSNTA